jgi:hypothetical protein
LDGCTFGFSVLPDTSQQLPESNPTLYWNSSVEMTAISNEKIHGISLPLRATAFDTPVIWFPVAFETSSGDSSVILQSDLHWELAGEGANHEMGQLLFVSEWLNREMTQLLFVSE